MTHALRPAASAAAQHAPAKKAAGAAQTVEGRGRGRRAGAKLRFAGFREGLGGAWVAAGALQRVDAAGYATLVEAAAGA